MKRRRRVSGSYLRQAIVQALHEQGNEYRGLTVPKLEVLPKPDSPSGANWWVDRIPEWEETPTALRALRRAIRSAAERFDIKWNAGAKEPPIREPGTNSP